MSDLCDRRVIFNQSTRDDYNNVIICVVNVLILYFVNMSWYYRKAGRYFNTLRTYWNGRAVYSQMYTHSFFYLSLISTVKCVPTYAIMTRHTTGVFADVFRLRRNLKVIENADAESHGRVMPLYVVTCFSANLILFSAVSFHHHKRHVSISQIIFVSKHNSMDTLSIMIDTTADNIYRVD